MNFVEKFQNVWDAELFMIEKNSVTVQKVLIAFLILFFGFAIIKYTTKILSKKLFRIHLKETTAAVTEKLLYYFALLLVVLFVLRWLNIPLTAFAFLGGAIAIGVGFGAQTLINNFISGFIIMAERPIKVGDIVEVEGTFAIVEEIGARCTRMRTGANVHILVPNSSFLEKNVTNWTLSDKMIRAFVTVGVVYGSPVREVERLLIKAVTENKKVIKNPKPFVLFNDFGDNALIFEIHFWISMIRLMERRILESNIRFRIDELFREAGIVIAFPQTDVHLDAKDTIKIRVVEDDIQSKN
jgi:small-conductance mechanosensitive channel